MTNELEEQVREELATSAHGWTDRIDHDRVLADGRRALRQRSLRRVAVAVAAAVVAGALGWAGLAGALGRGAMPGVVATPSPAPSTVTMNRVTFDLTGVHGADYARLELTLTTDGTVWMSGTDASGEVRFTTSIAAVYVTAHGATIDVGVPAVLGLVPGDSRWILPVTSGTAAVTTDVRKLPSGGQSAYLATFSSGGASQFDGVCWAGADGEVHPSDGSSTAHTDLDFEGHRGTFFFTDLNDKTRLTFRGDGGGSFSFDSKGGGYRPYVASERVGTSTRSMLVALLPSNATNPSVKVADPSVIWTTLDVAGRTLVVVSGTSDTMAGMVRSISYTDEADGPVIQRVR